jgi:hypothetical protein
MNRHKLVKEVSGHHLQAWKDSLQDLILSPNFQAKTIDEVDGVRKYSAPPGRGVAVMEKTSLRETDGFKVTVTVKVWLTALDREHKTFVSESIKDEAVLAGMKGIPKGPLEKLDYEPTKDEFEGSVPKQRCVRLPKRGVYLEVYYRGPNSKVLRYI